MKEKICRGVKRKFIYRMLCTDDLKADIKQT